MNEIICTCGHSEVYHFSTFCNGSPSCKCQRNRESVVRVEIEKMKKELAMKQTENDQLQAALDIIRRFLDYNDGFLVQLNVGAEGTLTDEARLLVGDK